MGAMEVNIVDSQGFEKDAIVSMRVGRHRRQASVASSRKFAFPEVPTQSDQLQVDVYQLVATGFVTAGAGTDDNCGVFFPTAPGLPARTLTLQVQTSPGTPDLAISKVLDDRPATAVLDSRPATADEPLRHDPSNAGFGRQSSLPEVGRDASLVMDVEARRCSANTSGISRKLNEDVDTARAYLQSAGLVEILQGVIRDLLREKPADVLVELTKRLQKLTGQRQTSDVASQCDAPEDDEGEGWPRVRAAQDGWRAQDIHKAGKRSSAMTDCMTASMSMAAATAEEDCDLPCELKVMERARGNGVSAEAYGAWNSRRAAFVLPVVLKTEEQRGQLLSGFQSCPLFAHLDRHILDTVIDAMPAKSVPGGTCVIKQGADGDCLYCLIAGTIDVYDDAADPPRKLVTLPAGRIFGELAMMYNTPRKLSIYTSPGPDCTLGVLARSVYQNMIVRHQMGLRERREQCLCRARCLETMNAEQIAQLADALESRVYEAGETIVRQGEVGDEFFIVQSGQCSATIHIGNSEGEGDVQEHRRYKEGDLFGERSLTKRSERAATVTALTRVEALSLSRSAFERMLGPLDLLQRQNYMTDPRRRVSDFYRSGDKRGSRGCIRDWDFNIETMPASQRTDWFAVFRPTSREAIALMLGGLAVGKGLNVKGKSAKKGRHPGMVPFLQISQNAHKELIAKPDPKARIRIFYMTEADREIMLKSFEQHLSHDSEVHFEGDRVIFYVDLYEGVFGLDIPEAVLHHVYITSADIEFKAGMQTGRKSEPDFMNMNSSALRSSGEPKIVLTQVNREDPKDPHGLMLAYAERRVKPVVSDFDLFLVGSRNMEYDALPPEQTELQHWTMGAVERILQNPGPGSWTTRWLDVVREATESGFYPKTPQFGFGDATSYRLIKEVVAATSESGAVRHGAECFNFFFPQELDDEYLVVWEGFEEDDKHWEYLFEDDLRDFLLARVKEGYDFPINPVWPIRDLGWEEVYAELKKTESGLRRLQSCFPDPAVRDKMERLMQDYPDGFLAHGTGTGGASRKSLALDVDASERANLAMGECVVILENSCSNDVPDAGGMGECSRAQKSLGLVSKEQEATNIAGGLRNTLLQMSSVMHFPTV